MSMKHLAVVSGLLCLVLFPWQAKAQSQSDINALQALMPWAEKLDQQRAEQRAREAEQAQLKWATVEQAIREREELAAAVLAERTARAKAIKTWNPKAYSAPPLFPGESLVYTLNGCGLVLPMPADDLYDYPDGYDKVAQKMITKKMSHRAFYGAKQWEGDCVFGLAEGIGTLAEPDMLVNFMGFQSGYVRGRAMNFYVMDSPENGTGQVEVLMGQDKAGAKQVSQLVRDNPYAGQWSGPLSNAPRTTLRIRDPANESYIATDTNDCTTFEILYKKKIKGCSYNNDFTVYSIVQGNGYFDANPTVTFCPNMKSSAGCEALWDQLAAPTIAKLKTDWATAQANLQKERTRIESFSAAWRAPLEKAEKGKQYAAIAGVEKTYKTNPKALTDAQISQLRNYYAQNGKTADLDRLDNYLEQRNAARERAAEVAQQRVAAASTPSPKSSIRSGTCSTYDQCVQVENASGLSPKLDAIPAENLNLKTRGIIAASEFMMSNYKQCLPDKRCQTLVNQYRQTRADTLVVCQKVSTDASSCTVSPF